MRLLYNTTNFSIVPYGTQSLQGKATTLARCRNLTPKVQRHSREEQISYFDDRAWRLIDAYTASSSVDESSGKHQLLSSLRTYYLTCFLFGRNRALKEFHPQGLQLRHHLFKSNMTLQDRYHAGICKISPRGIPPPQNACVTMLNAFSRLYESRSSTELPAFATFGTLLGEGSVSKAL